MLSSSAVSEELFVDIGRITVHFALLEKILIDLTHRLLRLPSFLLKERLPSKTEEELTDISQFNN